ncbi:MAG: hypothetical protein IJ584_13120 [Bacteroidales bacterium]|nr:hypothetical protein [Bacteroidales bacterium]
MDFATDFVEYKEDESLPFLLLVVIVPLSVTSEVECLEAFEIVVLEVLVDVDGPVFPGLCSMISSSPENRSQYRRLGIEENVMYSEDSGKT